MSKEENIPDSVMKAFQEARKRIEVIQTQLDKLVFRISQEQKRKAVASLALKFLQTPQSSAKKYYIQVGKAFAMRPFDVVKSDLGDVMTEIDNDLPKLYNTQAQFEIKKKEQWENLQQLSVQAKKVNVT